MAKSASSIKKQKIPSNARRKDYSKYPFMNLSLKDIKGEKWKPIPGYDDFLLVSNYGRVKSLARPVQLSTGQFYYTKTIIRKQYLQTRYNPFSNDFREQLAVKTRYGDLEERFLINRLVYALFIKKIDYRGERFIIGHKNGDNCDNRVENLKLFSPTERYIRDLRLKRVPVGVRDSKARNRSKDLTNRPFIIVQYTLDGRKVHEFESVGAAASAMGLTRSSIRAVATSKYRQLNGFVYRYYGDPYKGEYKNFKLEKEVTQYDLSGKKLKTYQSVKQASKHTGIDANIISKCALRKMKMGSGFVWRYQGDIYRGEYQNKIQNIAKPIVQYQLDGKIVGKFPSITRAALELGVSTSTISANVRKETKAAHGFVWRIEGDKYKGEYKDYFRGKPVTQLSLAGKVIKVYPSIAEAAQSTGLTSDNIQKNVHGFNKTAGGYVWREATSSEIKKLPKGKAPKYTSSNVSTERIIQYSKGGKKIGEYKNISDAVQKLKIPHTNIRTALDNPRRSSHGYIWRTKDSKVPVRKLSFENDPRQVTQYDSQGRRMKVFESCRKAGREVGVSSSIIGRIANGELRSIKGYVWRFGHGPARIKVDLSTPGAKRIAKYSIEGKKLQVYPSIAAAARAEGVSESRISLVINGKSKSAKGYLWKIIA
jgi:hypothetical protein